MDIQEATQLLVAGSWIKITSLRVTADGVVAADRRKHPAARYYFKQEALQGWRCNANPTGHEPQVPAYKAWVD